MTISILSLLAACNYRDPYYATEEDTGFQIEDIDETSEVQDLVLMSAHSFTQDGFASEISVYNINSQTDDSLQLNKMWTLNADQITENGNPIVYDESYEIFSPQLSASKTSLHTLYFGDSSVIGLGIRTGRILELNANGEVLSSCDAPNTHHSMALDDDGFAYFAQSYLVPVEENRSQYNLEWLSDLQGVCGNVKHLIFDRVMKMDLETCEHTEIFDSLDYLEPNFKPEFAEISSYMCAQTPNVFSNEGGMVDAMDFTHVNKVNFSDNGSDGEASLVLSYPYLNTVLEISTAGQMKSATLGRHAEDSQMMLQESYGYQQNAYPIFIDADTQRSAEDAGFSFQHGPQIQGNELFIFSNGYIDYEGDGAKPRALKLDDNANFATDLTASLPYADYHPSMLLGSVVAQEENLIDNEMGRRMIVQYGGTGSACLYNLTDNTKEWCMNSPLHNQPDPFTVPDQAELLTGSELNDFFDN